MKKITASVTVLLTVASFALGAGGNSPSDTADAQSRSSGRFDIDRVWAMGNPAFVGLESRRNMLTVNPVTIGLWNDKVALPFAAASSVKSYVAMLIRESFGVSDGLSPDEVSKKLTDELRDGIYLYAGVQSTPVDFASRGFGFNVRTFGDADMKIPGGLFMPFFSATEGLLVGSKLDLSATHIGAIWASEVGVKLGRSISVPAIRDFLFLDEGAAGVGVKVLAGHYYYSVEAKENSALYYDSVSNEYKMNMGFDVVSAEGGYGFGFDIGTVFHNDNHAVSINIQDIGVILWDAKNVLKGTTKSGAFDLNDKEFNIFKVKGEYADEDYVLWLPTALNVGYVYYLDISSRYGSLLGVPLGYLSANLGYNQQLVLGPGKSTYAPRVSAGAKLGILSGCLPVRYGIIGGGAEKIASTAGVGLESKSHAVGVSYKAVGSPILWPKNGFEMAVGLTSSWGGGKPKAKNRRSVAPPAVQNAPVDTAPPQSPPVPEPKAPQEESKLIEETPPAVQSAPAAAPANTIPPNQSPVPAAPAPEPVTERVPDEGELMEEAPPPMIHTPVDTAPQLLEPELEESMDESGLNKAAPAAGEAVTAPAHPAPAAAPPPKR